MTRIVTDSSSDISPRLAAELGITVLPMRIRFGTETYYDSVDISRADFYRYWAKRTGRPTAQPPTVEEFQQAYRRLLSSSDQVLSIHVSSSLSSTAQVARDATKAFLGRGKITVIDSRVISWGLEILVTLAAEAAKRGASVEDIVRLIRGVIPHIYMVFHVEDLDSVEGRRYRGMKRLPSENLPSTRPLLILEDGELIPMERVRSRGTLTEQRFCRDALRTGHSRCSSTSLMLSLTSAWMSSPTALCWLLTWGRMHWACVSTREGSPTCGCITSASSNVGKGSGCSLISRS